MNQPTVIGSELLRPETVSLLLVAIMREFSAWYREQVTHKEDGLEVYSVEFKSPGGTQVPDVIGIRITCSFVNEKVFRQRLVLESTCSLSKRRGTGTSFVFAPIKSIFSAF